MATAFVLSGGGNLGAVQVGMLAALSDAGIHPDLIVGTSVGAFNGAWIAGRGHDAEIEELADVWRGLRRSDVFPTNLVGGLRGFLGRTDHLVPSSDLRLLLHRRSRSAGSRMHCCRSTSWPPTSQAGTTTC